MEAPCWWWPGQWLVSPACDEYLLCVLCSFILKSITGPDGNDYLSLYHSAWVTKIIGTVALEGREGKGATLG